MKNKKNTEGMKRKARALAEEIARLKLLQALRQKSTEEKRPVSVLRPISKSDRVRRMFFR